MHNKYVNILNNILVNLGRPKECVVVRFILHHFTIKCLCIIQQGETSQYAKTGLFECLSCAEGCESCEDDRPCVVSLNWVMRTVILVLSCVIICCLPIVVIFTWKYGNVKVSSLIKNN